VSARCISNAVGTRIARKTPAAATANEAMIQLGRT